MAAASFELWPGPEYFTLRSVTSSFCIASGKRLVSRNHVAGKLWAEELWKIAAKLRGAS